MAESAKVTGSDRPVIILGSGQILMIDQIVLYDAGLINEISGLRAMAAQKFGGIHTGIGFWGSPTWALGGAATLGLLEGLLSNAAKKQGIQLLTAAQDKYRQMRNSGKLIDTLQISNISSPHPQTWTGQVYNRPYIHDGDEFVEIKTTEGRLCIRWTEVTAFYPPQTVNQVASAVPSTVVSDPPKTLRSTMLQCEACGRQSIAGTRICPGCNQPLRAAPSLSEWQPPKFSNS